MNVNDYMVKRGDTLGLIAYKYTGSKDRWIELLAVNPQIPKYIDKYGQKRFVGKYFVANQIIHLPYSWISQAQQRGGTLSGPGEMGTVGESCSPTPVAHYPGVLYVVHDGKMPAQSVSDDFGQNTSGGWGDYGKLNGANVNFWSKGFTLYNGSCVPVGWKDGIALRVPKAWLDIPPSQLSQLPALSHLVLESDGVTQWTPPTGGGGEKTPGTPGTQGNCPDGQVLASDGVTCIDKGKAAGVSATDTGSKTSTWLWLGLAAFAGIGGALLLNNLIKSKKVYTTPPSPSAPKGEIVVRR